MIINSKVSSGLDRLVDNNFKQLRGQRIALLVNHASVNHRLEHIIDLLLTANINLVKIFSPEHGIDGCAQDMESVDSHQYQKSQIPVISLYGADYDSIKMKPQDLQNIDILVCDLQDIGSRYYTFSYSIAFAMQACAEAGIKCIVLDRPNPIGANIIEGPVVEKGFFSFVGEYPISCRHGLTLGELCHLFNDMNQDKCNLEVIKIKNYQRKMLYEETGLPWVFPSPNMPTLQTASLYPGACLIEGTNLSEGRGTTKPFELIGAPYIKNNKKLVDDLNREDLPGVLFRHCYFTPKFQKYANKNCSGIEVHITNKKTFKPLLTYCAIILHCSKIDDFNWRKEIYEFVDDRLAIDLLFGSNKPREMIEKNINLRELYSSFADSQNRYQLLSKKYHLYN